MIIRYQKPLVAPLEPIQVEGYLVREYAQESDQHAWISIHQHAFGNAAPWPQCRFEREFIEKKWWEPKRMLFSVDAATGVPVGTITLGEIQSAGIGFGRVAWLAVEPSHHGVGLGKLLTSSVEALAISMEYDSLELETLSSWVAANRLYRALGWEPISISNRTGTGKNEQTTDE